MDSKRIPAASFVANAQPTHKQALSEAVLKLRHGKFVKDKKKDITMSGKIKHSSKPNSVDVSYNVAFLHPMKVKMKLICIKFYLLLTVEF